LNVEVIVKPWLLLEATRPTVQILLFLTTIAVSSCGGGSDGNSNTGNPQANAGSTTPTPYDVTDEIILPVLTGQTAIDGYHWFNFRRQQMGLAILSENALISKAAQAHSDYQRLNQTITHLEVPDRQGYTGVTLSDRLNAAQYQLPPANYAYGEVISAAGDTDGIRAAESLLGAIYHRFVVLEPKFTEAGMGAATAAKAIRTLQPISLVTIYSKAVLVTAAWSLFHSLASKTSLRRFFLIRNSRIQCPIKMGWAIQAVCMQISLLSSR